MRISKLFGGLIAGAACAVLVAASPNVDRVLKDKDIRKISSSLADWLEALEENSGRVEAEEDVRSELESLNKKKLKGGDLLMHGEDLGAVIYGANKYDKKAPKRGLGKVTDQSVQTSRGKVDFALWLPPKYRAKNGPYQVIITIPDEGVSPEKHISTYWMDGDMRDKTIIAAPKMPGDSKKWSEIEGSAAVFLTYRVLTETYAVDFERIFLGGRGRGGETAVFVANQFHSRFAGAFSWAGDAGEGIPAVNMRHVPVFISGGGARAAAFQERAKAAGIEGVTLNPSGAEAEILAWMGDLRRPAYPTQVSLVPGEKNFPTTGYWLQIARVADPSAVTVDAEVNRETNTITITGKGVTNVTLYLADGLVDLSKPVTVIANGAENVDTFERSFRTVLSLLEKGKIDPARVFVASKQYSLPSVAESDG